MVERFLQQTSAVFRHSLNKNVLFSRLSLEELKELISSEKPKQQDMLKCIDRLTVSLEKIVSVADTHKNELLNLFKLHSVNLFEMAERAVSQLQAPGISIEINKPESTLTVRASQILTEHILEILNNSIDAIRKHYPTPNTNKGNISINFLKENNDKNIITMIIRDNAGGVDPKVINKIAVSGFTTKNHTGIGLPLVQSYMESINGAIKFENLHPNGFSVSLTFQIDNENSI